MPMTGTFVTRSGTKAGTQVLPTPPTMSSDSSTKAEINGPADYKDQVNGILPGYSGHIPRARDKYGGPATGEVAQKSGPPVYIGPQQGHVRPEDVLPPRFVDYVEKSKGVVPAYTGHRPESVHVKNVSGYGGIPYSAYDKLPEVGLNCNLNTAIPEGPYQPDEVLQQGSRTFDWRRQAPLENPPSFRDAVGGVIPGYAGHVPRAVEKAGASHYGGLSPDKMYVPLAQTGHEGYKIDPATGEVGEKEVELKMIPMYAGHIPKARDAFGSSVYTKGR